MSSFDEFVVARGHELTKFAHLLAHDRADAEDLVQDTLASAFASWKRIEQAGSPEAYVRRMMVNQHISIWRRHRNRVEPRHELPERPSPDTTSGTDLAHALRGIVKAAEATRSRRTALLRRLSGRRDRRRPRVFGGHGPQPDLAGPRHSSRQRVAP